MGLSLMSKAILVNYNFTPTWLLTSGLDYYLYDRSEFKYFLKDFPQERIKYTENVGDVDYDKLTYIIDFYDNLPNVFLWGKSNLFKFIEQERFNEMSQKSEFTPLLTLNHKTYSDKYGQVCYYQDGMYYERNDSWYVNELSHKYFATFSDFAKHMMIPSPAFLPFAPGGNYILTRERVHKYAKSFYEEMRSFLDYAQHPAEAHMCERSYYLLWG